MAQPQAIQVLTATAVVRTSFNALLKALSCTMANDHLPWQTVATRAQQNPDTQVVFQITEGVSVCAYLDGMRVTENAGMMFSGRIIGAHGPRTAGFAGWCVRITFGGRVESEDDYQVTLELSAQPLPL